MITDLCPRRGPSQREFERSDKLHRLRVPRRAVLQRAGAEIMEALEREDRRAVLQASAEFLRIVSDAYEVRTPSVRVLGARPKRVYGEGTTELFGDYHLRRCQIRVWMRTAVRRQVTSPRGFINTLCHELVHHLDVHLHDLPHSYHTRGFYARTSILYHHATATPRKRLAWFERSDGRHQIDWSRMRAQG